MSVTINVYLYRSLPIRAKVSDKRLKGINTFLTRSLGPMVHVFETLCALENILSKNEDITIRHDPTSGHLMINATILDTPMVRELLGSSIKLL